jgi:lysozyme family protein
MPELISDNAIIDAILEREGGFVNHPNDKGGPTNHGITLETLQGYLKRPCTIGDIKNLTEEDARKIYQTLYISRPGFWVIQDPLLKGIVVDLGVNSGPELATKMLQRVLGVEDDGIFGDDTRKALAKENPHAIATKMVAARGRLFASILHDHPEQRVFAAGWMNRLSEFIDML